MPTYDAEFNSVIVRLSGEIGVKGVWTRNYYERLLRQNMKNLLRNIQIPYQTVLRKRCRFYVKTHDAEKVAYELAKVFGISSTSPAFQITSKLEEIVDGTIGLADNLLRKGTRFAVRCRRVGKHNYSSLDVCQEVGKQILLKFEERSIIVDLKNPNVTLYVEVRGDRAFLYSKKIRGVGGFPLGSQTKAVCLLSGGIDSSVACWLAMKRGCPPILLYLDNTPFTDNTTTKRVITVAQVLSHWASGFPRKLHVVSNGRNLAIFKEKCNKRLTCILCKRMMYRIAERITNMTHAEGIFTGESIGEHASQTLHNLRVLNEAAKQYPIHRPLLGFDKTETEKLARKIGTQEPCMQKTQECTAAPKKPVTKAKLTRIKAEEEKLNIEEMVETSVKSLRIMDLKHVEHAL
jgi:thiamine biosynthesis protein ThiI